MFRSENPDRNVKNGLTESLVKRYYYLSDEKIHSAIMLVFEHLSMRFGPSTA